MEKLEREAVRIDVILPFEVRTISEEEIKNSVARTVGDVPLFSYIPLKDTLDEALNNWLKLINAKLDYLINLLTREKEGFHKLPYRKVNISEKGLRFKSESPFQIGDPVEIKIVLDLYQPLGFYIYGKILRCEKKDEEYEVALEFVNLPTHIREKIGFFILNKEREMIREKRVAK
ncbi:MAG: PilZ domain-containing protein [Thermodesulfobacteriaceae bacterium]|nr:PilZ domain-containing protein [Thermodesulfobacteriaceae bacterium]MCX8041898.1 PilZ domain-containing protein [Thermodesulfobacteriaceae bacterium]MDW8135380.1 PilZ domain-containing protein [Thermodesulfobacterium sp.]